MPMPNQVIVKLLADGQDTGKTIALNDINGWNEEFENLPKFNGLGDLIVYSIEEVNVPGYTSNITGSASEGFVITNSELQQKSTVVRLNPTTNEYTLIYDELPSDNVAHTALYGPIETRFSLFNDDYAEFRAQYEGVHHILFGSEIVCNYSSLNFAFGGMTDLKTFDGTNLNTSNVTDMSEMFNSCNNLISLNVAGFDTSNVTDMSYMFGGCRALPSLNISNFDTSNVTNMMGMFQLCNALSSIDVSNFNTSNVTNMNSMFARCGNLTSLDLSNFNTSNVTDMGVMFSNCTALTILDLSNFNTSNVTDMNSMFNGCNNLVSLDITGFNTSKVTNMNLMFNNDNRLITLDLSGFNGSALSSAPLQMFNACSNLVTIYVNSFTLPESTISVFLNDTNLVGGAGTTYSTARVSSTYGRIDGGYGAPGYFTGIASVNNFSINDANNNLIPKVSLSAIKDMIIDLDSAMKFTLDIYSTVDNTLIITGYEYDTANNKILFTNEKGLTVLIYDKVTSVLSLPDVRDLNAQVYSWLNWNYGDGTGEVKLRYLSERTYQQSPNRYEKLVESKIDNAHMFVVHDPSDPTVQYTSYELYDPMFDIPDYNPGSNIGTVTDITNSPYKYIVQIINDVNKIDLVLRLNGNLSTQSQLVPYTFMSDNYDSSLQSINWVASVNNNGGATYPFMVTMPQEYRVYFVIDNDTICTVKIYKQIANL